MMTDDRFSEKLLNHEYAASSARAWRAKAFGLQKQKHEWMDYADKLEKVLELVCGESKDRLMKLHAEQGLRLVRPERQS